MEWIDGVFHHFPDEHHWRSVISDDMKTPQIPNFDLFLHAARASRTLRNLTVRLFGIGTPLPLDQRIVAYRVASSIWWIAMARNGRPLRSRSRFRGPELTRGWSFPDEAETTGSAFLIHIGNIKQVPENPMANHQHTVGGCEILHQLVSTGNTVNNMGFYEKNMGIKHHRLVQDFATIHSMFK